MAIVYVGDGSIFSMAAENKETVGALLEQLGSLLGVGRRDDGQYHLPDMKAAGELWAKYKSFRAQVQNFASDEERNEARKDAFFGIGIATTTHSDNSYVRLLSYSRAAPQSGFDPPEYTRIRDFVNYHPNAKSGILIKGSSFSILNDITLETNPKTSFNVTMYDLLEQVIYGDLTTFRWVLVDPFGFWHELGNQDYTKDTILEYLFGTSYSKIVVNITDDFKGKGYNNYQAIPSPNRPLGSPKWTLGLMGWKESNWRYILNPLTFTESSLTTCPVRISGFTPNMTIGTAYMGKTTLKDLLYNNGGESGAIACCSDDYVFMGFTMTNLTSSVFNATNIRMLFINNITSVRPYQTNVAVYNQASFSVPINPNTSVGNGGGLGTAWANGMLYFRVTNMWNIATNGFFALAYVGSNNQVQLLTPYIPITFKNKGVTVASINDSLKATLPSVKPVDNTWSTTIVTQ